MSYQDEINALFEEIPIHSDYYLKIRALLNFCYQNQFVGSPELISDLNRLQEIRKKKKNEGRSTKSALSATDGQQYVLNDIWKRLTWKEQNERTIDRARFLLDHFRKRADKKEPWLAKNEYTAIDQISTALDKEEVTLELLKSPEISKLLSDINPYKTLESYLNDAENLESKSRSKWRQELPFLLVVLGLDPKLLKEYLQDETPFLKRTNEEKTQDSEVKEIKSKWDSWIRQSWISKASLVIITGLTVYLLWEFAGRPLWATPHEKGLPVEPKSIVEQSLSDTQLFGPYLPFSSHPPADEPIRGAIKGIHFRKALIWEDTVPMNEMYLEVIIQNTSKNMGYVFEGLQVKTMQHLSVSGPLIQMESPVSYDEAFEMRIPCKKGDLQYYTISNPTSRILKPGEETLFSVKIVSGACQEAIDDLQIIPFRVGFGIQNVRGEDIFYEMKEVLQLGVK